MQTPNDPRGLSQSSLKARRSNANSERSKGSFPVISESATVKCKLRTIQGVFPSHLLNLDGQMQTPNEPRALSQPALKPLRSNANSDAAKRPFPGISSISSLMSTFLA